MAVLDFTITVSVDWKATRAETVEALGGLRILPDGARRVHDVVPEYDAFAARCAAADAELWGGPVVAAGDPLFVAGNEGLQYVVVDIVHRALGERGADLLTLENGDTPGYLAVTREEAPAVLARRSRPGFRCHACERQSARRWKRTWSCHSPAIFR